ncbi:MAG: Foldase protein PrsA 2 precursor [candidate division WS2 bacterium ADurb.Bin280]|uniref:peptidylprolyl isomerase n=1 Tax=candidate division WS2 bacterium ADurb.Bin280 TaxID=1852829 RepID=A0A1V5SEX6_9BACT|nr:MAG: Foldase protein PrsA 2 precursor [candidate division WS2 bacterium ADurb.Bin280]
MFNKIVSKIRVVERFLLKFFVNLGSFFKKYFNLIVQKLRPRWRTIAKTALISICMLYVIGAVAFGVRLYKQKKFEKIDFWASYVYPFPVSNVGRTFIISKGLNQKILWSKTFAQAMQLEVPEDIERSILEDMQNDAVIMQEAGRLGVVVTRSDLDTAFEQAVGGVGGEEQAIAFIKNSYGMNVTQFKQLMLPKIALERIREEKFSKVIARHILFTDENKAKEFEQKIREGANFEEVAKSESTDQETKESGGLLAEGEYIFRELSGLPEEMENELFKLNAGEMSGVVKSSFGYHLLKVEQKSGSIDEKPTQWYEQAENRYHINSYI